MREELKRANLDWSFVSEDDAVWCVKPPGSLQIEVGSAHESGREAEAAVISPIVLQSTILCKNMNLDE